jgi:dihydroorotase/N-acyl-D-amino-acid deacylase
MNKIWLFLGLLLSFQACTSTHYDVVIIGGLVIDGSDADAFSADIAIVNDRIVKIGHLGQYTADNTIDAEGLIVAPGFIDLHTHLDPIKELPEAQSHIMQGVTTALGGPDGSCPWPFGKYLSELDSMGTGLNVGYLTGHNTIRRNIMNLDNRAPTAEELDAMKMQVRQSMEEGAFGISTGLKYLPGTFSKVDEVIALSAVASELGGFYTSHLREEGLGLLDAVAEAIQIGKEANIPIVLTHHKVVGKPMWGKSNQTLAMVDAAVANGQDVMIDQYPYTASHTGIGILIPSWARAGGNEAFAERLKNPILRDSIKQGIIFNIINDRGGNDLNRVQFSRVSWKKELEGKRLHDWAIMENMEPTIENGAELVIKAQLNGGANCIFHAMDENDVKAIMKHPLTMIASDGRLNKLGDGHPHPRAYSTFPRVLGHYSRDEGVIPLKTAVYKMTGLPAMRMGLVDRSVLKEGNYADITIFDAEKVIDKATFLEPHQYPVGIEYVLVNGQLSVAKGEFLNKRNGRVLYGPATITK